MNRLLAAAAGLLLFPPLARAEATRVYSLQGADCESCAAEVRSELKKVKGVRKVDFDKHKVEITVRMDDAVADADVLAAVERAGLYAEWCGPCRFVDARLRELIAGRKDLAVRKLNVVDFDSPLAKELGSRIEALPYVIVFDPAGKRTDIVGADFGKLDRALGVAR